MLDIRRIGVEGISQIWDDVRPLLKKATDLSGGRYDVDDLLDPLNAGMTELWTVADDDELLAAFITVIQRFPRKSVLSLPIIGGCDMEKWLVPGLTAMEAYAKENGCSILEGGGRRAWAKVLAEAGWKTDRIVIEKELSNGTH